MNISGTLTVTDNKGTQHTINAEDFDPDEHLEGSSVTYSYDNDEFSVEVITEDKNGALSTGDWETKNCTVSKDDISFSLY